MDKIKPHITYKETPLLKMRPLNLTVWKCRRGNSNKKSSKSLTLTSWQRLVGGLGTGSLMNEG